MSKTQPSKIARSVASALWPQVQFQKRIDKGIYGFSCAGHGGIVAVIGACDIDEKYVDIARQQGHTEIVVVVRNGRRTRTYTSVQYQRQALIDLAAEYSDATLYEVWVGEEDCAWATIAYCHPTVIEKGRGTYFGEGVTHEDALSSLSNWDDRFLAAVTGRKYYYNREFLPKGEVNSQGGHDTFRVYLEGTKDPISEYATAEQAREAVNLAPVA